MLITPLRTVLPVRDGCGYESNRSAQEKPKVKVGRTSDKFDVFTVEGSW